MPIGTMSSPSNVIPLVCRCTVLFPGMSFRALDVERCAIVVISTS